MVRLKVVRNNPRTPTAWWGRGRCIRTRKIEFERLKSYLTREVSNGHVLCFFIVGMARRLVFFCILCSKNIAFHAPWESIIFELCSVDHCFPIQNLFLKKMCIVNQLTAALHNKCSCTIVMPDASFVSSPSVFSSRSCHRFKTISFEHHKTNFNGRWNN